MVGRREREGLMESWDEKRGVGVGVGVVKKLPIGFRFHPTDEEIVLHYLKRKVCSLPLPATVIPEFQVFQFTPWDLPGDVKEKRYFFCKKRRNIFMKKCSSSFSTDCGYWKSSGKEKQIMAPSGGNLVLGIKKSYVFYGGRKSPGLKTQWILHEFCLVASINLPNLTHQGVMMQLGDWVVCSIHQRKKKARNEVGMRKKSWNNNDKFVQRLSQPSSPSSSSSSSSCCSGITQISSHELDDQEATS